MMTTGDKLYRHIIGHPLRLIATCAVITSFFAALAGYQWKNRVEDLHAANVAACIADSELRQSLYVTFVDLGFSRAYAERFLPTTNCEELP